MSFHYKQQPQGPTQYGLIAEEVAKVYPELVTRNGQGEIEGVRYEELTPLLLTELQHPQRQMDVQAQQVNVVLQQLAELKAQNESLRAAVGQLQERVEPQVAAAMPGGRTAALAALRPQ